MTRQSRFGLRFCLSAFLLEPATMVARNWHLFFGRLLTTWILVQVTATPTTPTFAQTTPQPDHSAHKEPAPAESQAAQHTSTMGWQFMHDSVVFGTFNHQGGPRGETEFNAQNWWMGIWSRQIRAGTLQLNAMFSLDPLTVGKRGYSEIFQAGEAVDGRPLVDRQHPHDLVMQLAAVWRQPLTDRTTLTIAGGPVAEPSLGPVAFMHRASAAENSTAPLGHHTLDSTHIAMGVITGAIERGPWTVEGSIFNGREPDENRWDVMDPGALDSFAGRVWFRPANTWVFQISHGFLRKPEEVEPGDIRRTTFSASWFRRSDPTFSAVTLAFGRNGKEHGAFHALLGEATHRVGMNSIYGRLEVQQVETALLLTRRAPETPGLAGLKDTVVAFTVGGARDVLRPRGFELAIGGDVVFYGVPSTLEQGRGFCGATTCVLAVGYGARPVSFHIFLRLRPPAPMGRMWNMTMASPMRHETSARRHQSHR